MKLLISAHITLCFVAGILICFTMKIAQIIVALLFASFTWFQFNDPDPGVWAIAYGLVTLLTAYGAFRPVPANWYLAIGSGFTGWAYSLFHHFWEYITNQEGYTITQAMSFEKPYIEGTREFFGLVLAAGWMLFLYFRLKKTGVRTS